MIEWSILLRKPTVLLDLLGFLKQCLSPSHYMNKAATSSYRFLTYEFRKRGVIARLYNLGGVRVIGITQAPTAKVLNLS